MSQNNNIQTDNMHTIHYEPGGKINNNNRLLLEVNVKNIKFSVT